MVRDANVLSRDRTEPLDTCNTLSEGAATKTHGISGIDDEHRDQVGTVIRSTTSSLGLAVAVRPARSNVTSAWVKPGSPSCLPT